MISICWPLLCIRIIAISTQSSDLVQFSELCYRELRYPELTKMGNFSTSS